MSTSYTICCLTCRTQCDEWFNYWSSELKAILKPGVAAAVKTFCESPGYEAFALHLPDDAYTEFGYNDTSVRLVEFLCQHTDHNLAYFNEYADVLDENLNVIDTFRRLM